MEKPEFNKRIEKGGPNIEIPLWDPRHFFNTYLKKYHSFTAILCGARMSGKSNLLKHFLISPAGGNLAKKFDSIIVFSETLLNNFYQKMLPNLRLMFDEYKPEIIEAMKQLYTQKKKQGKDFKFLVIFDDMVVNMKWAASIEKFFYNSRHYGGSVFFLTQKCSAASQNWKANTTLFVILQTASGKEKKYISKDIISDAIEPQMPETAKEAEIERAALRIQNQLVQNYRALIITPYCEQKIKQYLAPIMPSK
jgi:hypothetical protein